MKRSFLCLAPLISAILPAAASPDNPLIPAIWFHELTATNGSTQQCIIFTTVPGVEYTFEHSDALGTWTDIGKTYGLGHEFAAAIRETAPAPPPPDPEDPPPAEPSPGNVSLLIQPSSDPAGGTVVSWSSLDHGGSVQFLIAGNMSPDWDSVPIFAETHGSHQFFITHPPGTTAAPEANPLLDSNDAAMIADLEAGFPGFNTAVATAAAIARNTPPPPPPAPDSKGFWRIKADWSLDSDSDGILDHAEFALAASQAAAGNGLVASSGSPESGHAALQSTPGDGPVPDPHNADTNNDGIPDGQQLDSDGDGIPDALDIAPGDSLVAYETIALPRYAMFTFADNDIGAFAINDRGTVLAPYDYWKAGQMHALITDETQIPGYPLLPSAEDASIRARAINDNDRIIGSGHGYLPGPVALNLDSPYFHPILQWPSPDAVPSVVSLADGSVTTYANLWDVRHLGHLDNSGSFFSDSLDWDLERQNPGPDYTGWRKWTLPVGNNPLAAAPAVDFSKGATPGGIVWGSKYDGPGGAWSASSITSPFTADIRVHDPANLLQSQNGSLIATSALASAATMVRKDGEWKKSPLLEHALDIAADGTAIRKRVATEEINPAILLNGKWTSLKRAAPGIPERWNTNPAVILSDTSPGGWILAHDRPGDPETPDDLSAALLPIRLEGIPGADLPGSLSTEEATGVDDFSIGATLADPAAQDRLWIMAPSVAGETALNIQAPVHASAPLTITAPGITFNGAAQLTLDGPSIPASIRATGTESGQEILAEISIGEADSVSQPIGFKVMKARTVRVAVYLVYDGLDGPDLLPSQQFLQDYLKKVFLRQVNVDFIVSRIDHAVTTDWDANGNGFLDTSADEDPSAEQQLVLDRLDELVNPTDPNQPGIGPAVTPDIKVFLMGGAKRVNNKAAGSTHLQSATCWISADAANNIPIETTPLTIAHEIGHIFFGEGHPNLGDGRAPLPGTRHHRRLMHSGVTGGFKPGVLTVKGEWDRADVNVQSLLNKRADQ